MLTNAIQKKPAAIGFAALDSKASAPLMDQARRRRSRSSRSTPASRATSR